MLGRLRAISNLCAHPGCAFVQRPDNARRRHVCRYAGAKLCFSASVVWSSPCYSCLFFLHFLTAARNRPINNTYVYDSQGQCISDWPENTCTTFRGGQYDANASRTYIEANSSIAVFDSTPNVTTQSLWAKDSLAFNSNLTLENFPLGIPRTDWGGFYDPQMVLGMGPNSTILSALKAAGKVSSRTWSFFWGLTGATPNVQMPGSFVLGGYDRAKVTGNNHTQPLSSLKPTCKTGMLVTIVDMQLNFPNGTSPSLFNGTLSAAMSACIQPDFPVIMTMPYDPYYAYFMELAGGTFLGRSLGVNYYGMNYAPQNVYAVSLFL